MTSENVHLDTFPDTVQTAQNQLRKCGGVKGRQLSGLLNEEHPPHQSQHTHHANNIKSVSQYLLLDPNLCRLEQGALSSEVTKSPIFIVGMVGCNVAPCIELFTKYFCVYQLLSIPKVLLFAVIVIVAFLGFYFRYQKKLVWSDDNIWTVISNLSTFLIDCGRYPINVYCILSTIALKAGEWDFLEWEKGETGSWDHQLHLRWTQSERKPQKS